MFFAGDIVSTQTCYRCKLEYPRRNKDCHHCANLSDEDAALLKGKYKADLHDKNHQLRRNMIIGILIVTNLLMIGFMLI